MFYVASLRLTEDQRLQLKEPLGELIRGTRAQCNKALKEIIAREKPTLLVLVGDTVTRNAFQAGVKPDVAVIDHMEKRRKALDYELNAKHMFRIKNPAGMIELTAWAAVDEAVKKGASIIEVDGEEDLLAIPAVLSSPDKSIVVYGQPGKGIVLVRVSSAKKNAVREIVDEMEKVG